MEHFIRERETWLDPSLPFTNVYNGRGELYRAPPFKGWPAITDLVFHYPGADWKDLGWEDFNLDGKVSVEDTVTLMRLAHRSYLLGDRGYSLGYGFYIGVLGDIWKVRGWDYANAANLGELRFGKSGWNNYSMSVHMVVNIIGGVAQPANAKQVAAANWLIDTLEKMRGIPFTEITYHGRGQATPCAGQGVNDQIKNKIIWRGQSVVTNPPTGPLPAPTPPVEEVDMTTAYIWRHKGYANAWLCGVGPADHMTPETIALMFKKEIPLISEVHAQKLQQCMHQSGIGPADLVPTADGQ